MALADFQQLLMDMVSDQQANITPDVRDRALTGACVRYGSDRPRVLTADVIWTASGVFGPAPTSWDEHARLQVAEYPVGHKPAATIFADVYRTDDGWGLESLHALPAGAVVRVIYSALHVLNDQDDTIPLEHRLPVAQYAAYLLCQQLATRFSGERETAIGADVARTETRAKEYRSAYFAGTAQADPYSETGAVGAHAAAGVVSWPRRNPRFGLVKRGVL